MDTSRRQVIRSLAGGSILFPGLLSVAARRGPGAGRRGRPAGPEVAALPGQGEAGDHAAHERRRVAHGHVRPQAAAHRRPRQAVRAPGASRTWGRPGSSSPAGECGTEVSELFPHVGDCMDDICLIRSMRTDHNDHTQATLGIHTGSVSVARPSLGSWVSYGLGTENREPALVRRAGPAGPLRRDPGLGLRLPPRLPPGDARPGRRRADPRPQPPGPLGPGPAGRAGVPRPAQPATTSATARPTPRWPPGSARSRPPSGCSGRCPRSSTCRRRPTPPSTSTAWSGATPRASPGSAWSPAGWPSAGVRFVELIDVGSSNNWDAHGNMQVARAARPERRPADRRAAQGPEVARDARRDPGRLDDRVRPDPAHRLARRPRATRTPPISSWLAGGGIKGGIVHGKTDDYGAKVVEDEVHVHDFHATILHLLGFDHTRLTYRHAGRDFRLTDVAGNVVEAILA